MNLRRNYLFLFDQTQTEAVKLDVSLGVSLVDRDQQDALNDKIQREHPSIPGARLTNKEDRGPLHVARPVMREQERANRAMARPAQAMQNNFVGDSIDDLSVDVNDPQQVIRQAKA